MWKKGNHRMTALVRRVVGEDGVDFFLDVFQTALAVMKGVHMFCKIGWVDATLRSLSI